MGLFDKVVGAAAGAVMGGDGEQGTAMQMIVSLIRDQEGGIFGFVDRLKEGGLADEVSSWIGDDENMEISASQLTSVLGEDTISSLAEKFDIDMENVSSILSSALPEIINKFSPDGELEEGSIKGLLSSLF